MFPECPNKCPTAQPFLVHPNHCLSAQDIASLPKILPVCMPKPQPVNQNPCLLVEFIACLTKLLPVFEPMLGLKSFSMPLSDRARLYAIVYNCLAIPF